MNHTFFCIDGHTCGNPVRLVSGGAPHLVGNNMIEYRADFTKNYDWIRKALMFEPRGHDAMSGTIVYPSTRSDCDVAVLFIEVSGCLAMCGHGTIGTVTFLIENGLVYPKKQGILHLDTPAGVVLASYQQNEDKKVVSVKLTNVASFLYMEKLSVDVEGLGEIIFDVSYGGNFYAIIEPQNNFQDMSQFSVADIQKYSALVRQLANQKYHFEHPLLPEICGLSHVMWTGKPLKPGSSARNAVFYGEKGIDRSPCGTGTSARLAQLVAQNRLQLGDSFVHESIIGTTFKGVAIEQTKVGSYDAIIPTIEGWARMTGHNTIFVNDDDPLSEGFLLK